MRLLRYILVATAALTFAGATAYSQTLLELERPFAGELHSVGFELDKDGDVQIDAVGLKPDYRDDMLVYAWIIDAGTREPVWVMSERDARHTKKTDVLYEEDVTKHLKKGKYELYLYAGGNLFSSIKIDGSKGFISFLEDLFDGKDREGDLSDLLEDCYVRLSSSNISSSDLKTYEVTGDVPGALVKYNQLGDEEYVERGFTLTKPGNLHIYSIIEYPRGNQTPVDYGWIVNADTREKVWQMDDWNTDWAGGGDKNRKFDDDVHLDKGNYILYFVTDDSHSFDEFNVNPPYDPYNWGITITPGKDFDRSSFKEYKAPGFGNPLIDFTRVGDDEYHEQAFRLKDKESIHIYAIGEYSRSDREFVDFGWIQDAISGKMVWEMTRSNTEHAGGDDKNRMFDGYVDLPKGDYIVAYVTDDSHSYGDWNAAPPFNPKAWGIAVFPGDGFNKDKFELISMAEVSADGDMLVNITRVGDNQKRKKEFTLDKETRVHIYALGEGDRDEFHDFAYIVNEKTGMAVWEMTWRNTFHAGGARKNRVFDGDIILDPGTYAVHYVTDGSHAFNDWNAARPDDPFNWGIKISRID